MMTWNSHPRQSLPPLRRRKRSIAKKNLCYCLVILWILVLTLLFVLYCFGAYTHLVHQNDDETKNQIQLPSSKHQSIKSSFMMNTGSEKKKNELKKDNDPKIHPIPDWIVNYIQWHNTMRAKYPGRQLLEHPDAPKTLTRICLGLCGGLNDRLGQLPLDLYLANQTQRVLLIKWQKPQPLEEFLIPPSTEDNEFNLSIDWTFPKHVKGWGTLGDHCHTLNECAREVRSQPNIPGNVQNHIEFDSGKQYEALIENDIHLLNEGDMKDKKDVTFTILGHLSEDYLEKKLRELGEVDMIHNTPTFGNIFRAFFKPHPNVQKQIDETCRELGLMRNEYTIAHCRVRHPKAYPMGTKFNGEFIANADKTGLPFVGKFQELSLGIASRAVECAARELQYDVSKHPIYFMSDSSDLVTYFAHNLTDSRFISNNPEWFDERDSANATAREIVSKYNVVARDQSIINAHIDKNKGRPSEAYYATFVDLFLGIEARCVSFGIGNYAVLAMKISGTDCKIRYAKELWGEYDNEARTSTRMCTL